MVIVDGPDGAGKSTLCTKLQSDGRIKTILESPARTRGNVPLWDQSIRYINRHGSDHKIIVDRFLFSEMAYGPILRGKCQFSTRQYLQMLANIIESGSYIIFCLPNIQHLKFKVDENPAVVEKIELIHASYRNLYESVKRIHSRVYRYEWNENYSYPQLLDFLEE